MKKRFTKDPTGGRTLLAAFIIIILAGSRSATLAQENPEQASLERARANFGRPVTLAADDVRAFPEAPAGFNNPPAGGIAGRVEVFAYDSTVTGARRKAVVYLPPHYSADRGHDGETWGGNLYHFARLLFITNK